MHIKTLAATGVKGRNFTHELSPLVLFTGKNFSGKTSRLEAIRFAFLGYIPELGKQNFSTLQMIQGCVDIYFEPAGEMKRLVRKVGDTVKVELGSGNLPDGFLDRPMPFLNAEEYFALTETERIQYIFAAMQVPASYTPEGIVADLRNISLEENTEDTETAKGTVVMLVEKALREHGISRGLTELTKDKGILKTEFGFYNKRAKETMGAVRVLSELKAAVGDVSAETLAGVQAELTRIGAALAAANQTLGSLTNQQMEANRVDLRRKQLQEALDAVLTSREAQLDDLEKSLKAIKVPAVDQAKFDAAGVAKITANNALYEARSERDGTLDEIEVVEDQIAGLKKLKACPTCKAAGANWRAGATKEYKANLAFHKAKLTKQETAIAELVTRAKRAQEAYDKLAGQWEKKQAAEKQQSDIRNTINSVKASVAGKEATRRAQAEELASLQSVAPPSAEELSAAADKVAKLKEKEAAVKEREASILRLQQDLLRAAQAAKEHTVAASRATVIKKVGEGLKEKQAEMIDNLFGGLMETANYFTQGILRERLIFHEGEIGYARDGRFVSHKTFSGTEKALTYIAVAAALSKSAPFRLVLLDEMGRLDRYNKIKIFTRMTEAVRDKIVDQVIAIDTATPEESDGWTVIPLSDNNQPKE